METRHSVSIDIEQVKLLNSNMFSVRGDVVS
jgi:hypothetical protein